MLKFFYSKQGGVISIMLSFILVAILAFSSTLVEIGRVKSAQAILHEADINAGYSLLSTYDKNMLLNYGLLALGQEQGQNVLVSKYQKYLSENLGGSLDAETKNTINKLLSGYKDAEVEPIYSLNENNVLERQILETMKYRAPINMVADRIELTELGDTLKSAFSAIEPLLSFASEALKIAENFSTELEAIQNLGTNAKKLRTSVKSYDDLYGKVCGLITKRDKLYKEVKKKPEFKDEKPSPAPVRENYNTDEEFEEADQAFREKLGKWEEKEGKYKEELGVWEGKMEEYEGVVSDLKDMIDEYLESMGTVEEDLLNYQTASDHFAEATLNLNNAFVQGFLEGGIQGIKAKEREKEKDEDSAGANGSQDADEKVDKVDKQIENSLKFAKDRIKVLESDATEIKDKVNEVYRDVMQLNFDEERDYFSSHNADAFNIAKVTKKGIDNKRVNVDFAKLLGQLALSFASKFIEEVLSIVKDLIETVNKLATVVTSVCGQGFWVNPMYSVEVDTNVFNNLSSKKVRQGASVPSKEASDKTLGQWYINDAQEVANQLNYDTSRLTLGRSDRELNKIQALMKQLMENSSIVISNVSDIINAQINIPILSSIKIIDDWLDSIARGITAITKLIPTIRACVNVAQATVGLQAELGNNIFDLLFEGALISSYGTEVFSNRTNFGSDSNIFGRKFDEIPRGTQWVEGKDFIFNAVTKIGEIADFFKPNGLDLSFLKNIDPPNKRAFAGAEAEYIFGGSQNEMRNQEMVSQGIFALRMLCNIVTVATNSEAMEIVASSTIAAPLVFLLFVLAESAIDMIFLVNGGDIPLIKVTDKMAFLSAAGIDNLIDKASELMQRAIGKARYNMLNSLVGAEDSMKDALKGGSGEGKTPETDDIKGISKDFTDIIGDLIAMRYQDYLWTFLCFVPNNIKVSRIGDLIEMQMGSGEKEFRLSRAYTYVRTSATGEYELLIPISGITGAFEPETINYAGY